MGKRIAEDAAIRSLKRGPDEDPAQTPEPARVSYERSDAEYIFG